MAREKIHIDLVLNTKGFRPLGRINGQLGEFEKSLDASNARVLAFGASAGAILAVKKAFTSTVKAAIEVEKSLQDINVILGATSQNLKKFGSELFEIASKTGQAFQVAATAATELARQGLGTEETLKRTRDALILARLAGMDAAEAVNALTAAINTFNKAGLDSTTIINKLANVDAAFAVSSDDLAKALGRVGSSAQAAGVNFDQLLAIVTTVQQKTARGGAVIGNSFKTIFTRIQRPRVIKELENLGVAIRGVEGDVLPAMKVLQNLARQFDSLSQAQKAQITELIGGVFQVNILKAAMSDLSKETGIYNRALGVSIGSSDQALKRNEELNKTLSAQFQRTVNTFKEGAAELGQLTMGPTLEKVFGFVDELGKFSETDMGKVGGAIAKSIFEGIGKFMSGPGLLVIGLVLFKTFSQLGKFAADAFKTLTGLNKNLQTQMGLQRQVFDVLSENPDLLKKIKDGTMTVEEAHEQIFRQIQKNTGALDSQLLVSNQLAKSLMGGGVGMSADFGATAGKKSRKFGSAGYVPSFAADRGEVLGMMAGGYSRSQVKNPKTRQESIHNGRGGVFNATVNGHESVFTKQNSQGKKATFVVPPNNSKAYDKYMSALSGGFIPNFNQSKIDEQEEYLKKLRAWQTDKSAHGGMPTLSNNKEKNELGKQAGKVFGRKLWTTPSLPTILSKAEAAHKKFRHNYDKSSSKDRTGQDQPVIIEGDKKYDYIKGKSRAVAGTKVYDAKKRFGLLGLYGAKKTDSGYAEAAIGDIAEYKGLDKKSKNQRIGFKNLQYRSLTDSLEDGKQTGDFSKNIRKHFAPATENLANESSKKWLDDDAISVSIGKSGSSLFAKGAEGEIFETVINALSGKGKKFGAHTDARSFEKAISGDRNRTWDFEEVGAPDDVFRKRFGFTGSLLKGDAKRTLSKNAGSSLVNKIFNTKGDFEWGRDMDVLKSTTPRSSKNKAAGGYIPNFNALHEAVRRERDAGVPAAKIRVGRSDRLKNGVNPSGFGIYNTRDEPMGLNQGINNSMAAGMDPKRRGKAGGFIPNFEEGGNKGSATSKNTKAIDKNTQTGMKSIGQLMILQQATTGLQNMMGENNNVAQGITKGIASVVTTMITLKYAMDSLPDNWTKKTQKTMEKWGSKRPGGRGADNAIAPGGKFERNLRQKFDDNYAIPKGKVNPARKKGKLGTFWSGADESSSDYMLTADEMRGKGGRGKGLKGVGKRFKAGGGLKGGLGRGLSKGLGAGMAGGFTAIVGMGAAAGAVANVLENSDLSPTFKEARLAGKAFERIKEQTEKNIGKLNAFGTSAEQAMATFNDQTATIGQVINASRKMEKELIKLPAEIRAKLGGVVDPTKIGALKDQLIASQQKKSTEAEQRKTGANVVRENTSNGPQKFMSDWMGIGSTLGWLKTGGPFSADSNIEGKSREEMDQDKEDLSKMSERIITDAAVKDPEKFRGLDLDKILGELGSANNNDPKALEDSAKKLGITESDMKILIKAFKEGGNASAKLVAGLGKSAIALQKDLRLAEASRAGREKMLKLTKEANQAVKNQKRFLEVEQKIRKAVLKITQQGANEFLNSVGKIKLGEGVKLGEAQQDMATKMGTATTQIQTSFNANSEALSVGSGAQIGSDVQAIIAKAGQGGLVTEAETSAQAGEIDKLIAKFNAGDDDNEKAQIKGLEDLKSQLLSLNGTQQNALKDLKDQTKEIRETSKAQIMVAQQQKRLKSFGGPQALLDPSKLNSPLNKIMAGGRAMASAGRAGSGTGVNRGRINQLSGMQELFGGSLPAHLQKEGVEKATQVGIKQMTTLNNSLGMGMSKEEIRKAASEQAANLFKGDPMKMNTTALESLTKTLNVKNALVAHSRTDNMIVGQMGSQNSKEQMARYAKFRGGMQNLREGMGTMSGRQQGRFSKIHARSLEGYTGADFWNDTGTAALAGGGAGMLYGGLGGSVVPGAGNVVGAAAGGAGGYALGGMAGATYGGIKLMTGAHDQDAAMRAGGSAFGSGQGGRYQNAQDEKAMEQMRSGMAAININLGGISAQGRLTAAEQEEVQAKMSIILGEAFAEVKARQDATDAAVTEGNPTVANKHIKKNAAGNARGNGYR